MVYKDIKDFFLKLENIKIDIKLYRDIADFRRGWAQKNNETIDFLGGKMVAAEGVRFSSLDESILFEKVIKVNHGVLIIESRNIKDIDTKFKVSSNILYILLLYIAHLFTIDNKLKENIKELAIKEIFSIISYKILTSLMAHYFRHGVKIDNMKSAINKMSKKFLLAKLNNWQELIDYRSRDILKNGLHYKRMINFSSLDFIRVINDVQTKYRSIIKNIFKEILASIKENNGVSSISNFSKENDSDKLIFMEKEESASILKLFNLMSSPMDIINSDLLYLLGNYISMYDEKKIKKALNLLVSDLKGKKEVSEAIILFGYQCLHKKKITDFRKEIVEIIKVIKNNFFRSDLSPGMKESKKNIFNVLKKNIKVSPTELNILVGSIMVYLFVLAVIEYDNS